MSTLLHIMNIKLIILLSNCPFLRPSVLPEGPINSVLSVFLSVHLSLPVCLSTYNSVFSRLAHYFFLIFCMKWGFNNASKWWSSFLSKIFMVPKMELKMLFFFFLARIKYFCSFLKICSLDFSESRTWQQALLTKFFRDLIISFFFQWLMKPDFWSFPWSCMQW